MTGRCALLVRAGGWWKLCGRCGTGGVASGARLLPRAPPRVLWLVPGRDGRGDAVEGARAPWEVLGRSELVGIGLWWPLEVLGRDGLSVWLEGLRRVSGRGWFLAWAARPWGLFGWWSVGT